MNVEVMLHHSGFNDEAVEVGDDLEGVEVIIDGLSILVEVSGHDDVIVDATAIQSGRQVRYELRQLGDAVQLVLSRL